MRYSTILFDVNYIDGNQILPIARGDQMTTDGYKFATQYVHDGTELRKYVFKLKIIHQYGFEYKLFIGTDHKEHRLYPYKYKAKMWERLVNYTEFICETSSFNPNKEYLFHLTEPHGCCEY